MPDMMNFMEEMMIDIIRETGMIVLVIEGLIHMNENGNLHMTVIVAEGRLPVIAIAEIMTAEDMDPMIVIVIEIKKSTEVKETDMKIEEGLILMMIFDINIQIDHHMRKIAPPMVETNIHHQGTEFQMLMLHLIPLLLHMGLCQCNQVVLNQSL